MARLLALVLAGLSLGARAELVRIAGAAPPLQHPAVYSYPSGAWGRAEADLAGLRKRFPDADPVLAALERSGWAPGQFCRSDDRTRATSLLQAVLDVEHDAAEEARALLPRLAATSPAHEEYPLLVARLYMLQGPLNPYLPEALREPVARAYALARARLSAAQETALQDALDRTAETLTRPGETRLSAVEAAAAAGLPAPPALLSPKVVRLRAALAREKTWEQALATIPPPSESARGFALKVGAVKLSLRAKRLAARRLYRPVLELLRVVALRLGEMWRGYAKQGMSRHGFRWHVVESLHRKGDFRGAFGHEVHDGTVEPESPINFDEKLEAALKSQELRLGEAVLSPMMGTSGMSFPQLSALSHLSLVYIHAKLAKALGVRLLYNSGEGGPDMHLGLIEGDGEKVKRHIVEWNLANGQFRKGGWGEARAVAVVDLLMEDRERVLKEFPREDLAKIQLVAQFGSALNGIRGLGHRVDFDKLRALAAHPNVVMIQYKLKQAAKRGAKVDPRKIDALSAAFREIPRDQPFKAPEVIIDFDDAQHVAELVAGTRAATKKPVSLKLGIGDVKDFSGFMTALRDAGALPDHLQLDGRGHDFSPGSGNAPPYANSSLPSDEAVIVADAVLRKLGIRDKIVLDATGDVLLPMDGIKKLVLGADIVSSARGWMGVGVGCAMVMDCASGHCPYGITSKADSFLGLGLDPAKVAAKGALAAASWYDGYVHSLTENKIPDWRRARLTHGLGAMPTTPREQVDGRMLTLDLRFDVDYVTNLLRGVMERPEVETLVFGRRP